MFQQAKYLLPAALFLVMTACGSESPKAKPTLVQPQVQKTTETNTPVSAAPSKSGSETDSTLTPESVPFLGGEGPAGQVNVACSYNTNGKLSEGKTQEECDRLKKEFEKANGSTTSTPIPSGSSTEVACAYNIDGKLHEGKSQAECDKLKKDLGLSF